jgi:hypothetical protein
MRQHKGIGTIKNIYEGIPSHLQVFPVPRENRKHPWSFIPGGFDVVVEYHEIVRIYKAKALLYDWVKKPDRYIQAIFGNELSYMSEEEYFDFAKDKMNRVFIKYFSSEKERQTTKFQEIWNCQTSDDLPWESLEKFRKNIEEQLKLQEELSSADYEDEDDDTWTPRSKESWYGYEPDFELAVDKAERLYGIPDPRLVEF